MPNKIRNEYDKKLSYDNLMKAHLLSRSGKGYRKDVILFNLKQEEYILWLYEQLKDMKYKHRWICSFLYKRAKGKKDREK